jgi:DNA-3-methyladenine glycosylase II
MVTSSRAGQAGAGGAGWLEEAKGHLRQADPVLAGLIAARPDFDPRQRMTELPPMDLFGALLFQIVGQQLSVAATRRILERIEERFGGRLPSPADVLATDPARFRDTGLSWRKISALRELAERLSDGRLDPKALAALADDELIAVLTEIPGLGPWTAIPGLGPWTAQGALIMALGREDVVRPSDLALRQAVRTVYRLDHLPAEEEVLAIAEKWRPYRSLATAYLFSARLRLVGPLDEHDGAVGARGCPLAHRAEQQPGERRAAADAEYQQLRTL